ncbi:MAG: hypothetical protein Fur0025_00760 [Oscillatoriaceae cyanobacterium]
MVVVGMLASLWEDEVKIELNRTDLKIQLADNGLESAVGINFKLAEKYQLKDELKNLDVEIKNTSNRDLYVDWDYSSFVDAAGRSQRLVRLTPGMSFDLLPPQVFSTIAPGKTLKEKLTAESTLKRDQETSLLTGAAPLIEFSKFKSNSKQKSAPSSFTFALRLALRHADVQNSFSGNRFHVINCEFTAKKLPRQSLFSS